MLTYCSFRIRCFGQFEIERLGSFRDCSDVSHLLTWSSVPDTGTGLAAEACVSEETVRFCFGGRSGVVDSSGSTSGAPHSSGGGAVDDRLGRCGSGRYVRSNDRSWKWSTISAYQKLELSFFKLKYYATESD